jgi:hypothetical protein
MLRKLKYFLSLYKGNPLLRAINIVCLSVLLWYAMAGGIREAFVYPILVFIVEYVTINTIFDMDFAPIDIFARRVFGSKNTKGWKITYVVACAWVWLFFIITLIKE